jgi:hypothetical protein
MALDAERAVNDVAFQFLEHTVSGWLARLVADGSFYNETKGQPRGYGLPVWKNHENDCARRRCEVK